MNSNFLEPRLVSENSYNPEEYYSHEPGETIYLKLCRAVVLAAVFLVPLFFLPWTTSVLELNKQMLLIVLSGAALILWLLHVVVSGRLLWRPNSVDAAVGSVLAASALATLFSLTRFKSLFGLTGSLSESLIVVLGLSILYFVTVHSFQDKGKSVKMVMVTSLCLALLYGVLQLFGLYIFKYLNISILKFTESNAFNSIGSVNSLGLLGAVALPVFYRFKGSGRYSYVGKIGAFLALALLVILNWWALWVVAIAGMAFLIAVESMADRQGGEMRKFRLARFIFPMTVIVLGVFLMIVNFNLSALKAGLPIEVAPSFGLSGQVAADVLKKSPAFGYGPENFSLAFDRFGVSSLSNTTLSSAKFFDSTSQIMNFAVSGGVVLLVAIAFLLLVLALAVFKRFNGAESSENAGVVSALGALVIGMFLYPFNLTLMFLFYAVVALTVLALWRDESKTLDVEEKASTSLISSLGFIGGLILVLVGAYFGASVYVSDLKYAQALSTESSDKAVQLLVESINWNGNDDRYYRAAAQVALNLLVEELNKKPARLPDGQASEDRTAKVQNYIASSINLARRATEVGPKEATNWSNLGAVYQSLLGFVDGVEKLSEDAYLRAADLRPGDASYFNQIGATYLASADLARRLSASGGADKARFQAAVGPALEKAEENFKKAIDVSNNFGLAIYNLGVVYDRQGKLGEAITQLERIMPFNSNQPGLAFELGLLYYRVGQKDKASNELQRAVLLSPDFANARWYLALIYEERQDFDSAIDQLEKILSVEANKNNAEVLAKLEQLRSGQKASPPKKVIDQKPL